MNRKMIASLLLLAMAAAVFSADVSLTFGFTFNAWDSAAEGPSSSTLTGYGEDSCENFIKLSASGKKAGLTTRLWYGRNANVAKDTWGVRNGTWLDMGYGGTYGEGSANLYLFDIDAWVRPTDEIKIRVGNNLDYCNFKETINWTPIGNRMTGSLGTIIEYTPFALPGLVVAAGQMFNDIGSLAEGYTSNANTTQDLPALGQSGLAVKYKMDDITVGLLGTINDFDGGAVGWTNSWKNWSVGGGIEYNGAVSAVIGASAEFLDYYFYMLQGGAFVSTAVGPFNVKISEMPVFQPETVPNGVTFANIAKLQISYNITKTIDVDIQAKHSWNYNAFTKWDAENPAKGDGYNTWGKAFATKDGATDLFVGTSLGMKWGECTFRPGFYIYIDLAEDADFANEWYIPLSLKFSF